MRFCVLALLAAATPAAAEWNLDFYGGAAYTPRSDFTLVVSRPSGSLDHSFHDVEWDTSAAYGLRVGYWLESKPWFGMALDIFQFNADIPAQTVNTTIQNVESGPLPLGAIDFAVSAIAFDLRLRTPLLASAEFPRGRLQPSVTAGPAIFRVEVTNRGNSELTTRPATDTVLGYKLGAGLSFQLTKAAAIFGEYRFTHFHAEPVLDGTITGGKVPMRFDLDTHHLVAGVSWLF